MKRAEEMLEKERVMQVLKSSNPSSSSIHGGPFFKPAVPVPAAGKRSPVKTLFPPNRSSSSSSSHRHTASTSSHHVPAFPLQRQPGLDARTASSSSASSFGGDGDGDDCQSRSHGGYPSGGAVKGHRRTATTIGVGVGVGERVRDRVVDGGMDWDLHRHRHVQQQPSPPMSTSSLEQVALAAAPERAKVKSRPPTPPTSLYIPQDSPRKRTADTNTNTNRSDMNNTMNTMSRMNTTNAMNMNTNTSGSTMIGSDPGPGQGAKAKAKRPVPLSGASNLRAEAAKKGPPPPPPPHHVVNDAGAGVAPPPMHPDRVGRAGAVGGAKVAAARSRGRSSPMRGATFDEVYGVRRGGAAVRQGGDGVGVDEDGEEGVVLEVVSPFDANASPGLSGLNVYTGPGVGQEYGQGGGVRRFGSASASASQSNSRSQSQSRSQSRRAGGIGTGRAAGHRRTGSSSPYTRSPSGSPFSSTPSSPLVRSGAMEQAITRRRRGCLGVVVCIIRVRVLGVCIRLEGLVWMRVGVGVLVRPLCLRLVRRFRLVRLVRLSLLVRLVQLAQLGAPCGRRVRSRMGMLRVGWGGRRGRRVCSIFRLVL
ncbi:hypothetical protein FA15DRAFT_114885 [Coprinopsis marcescibilis]|uniref:Uncharacterized protein n=1 Tax=Coprinopsis marcescibilis TaxID=230819 RepID=A0A5C3KKH7_COPMA|nr:hypothetical protein FA15DRAFT_114885 [Coprinopsis marcescibilis]